MAGLHAILACLYEFAGKSLSSSVLPSSLIGAGSGTSEELQFDIVAHCLDEGITQKLVN